MSLHPGQYGIELPDHVDQAGRLRQWRQRRGVASLAGHRVQRLLDRQQRVVQFSLAGSHRRDGGFAHAVWASSADDVATDTE